LYWRGCAAAQAAHLPRRRRPALRAAVRPRWSEGTALAWLAALVSATALAAAQPPLARLAAGAQALAGAVDAAAGSGALPELVQALGGAAARQDLLLALAHFSAAMDAPATAERQWARAGEAAAARGDRDASLAAVAAQADVLLGLGDYERALALAGRLGALARAAGDAAAQGLAENVAGVVERRRGRLDAALARQQAALARFGEAGDAAGATRALADLGTLWRDRGDFARALDAALEVAARRERSGDNLENAYRNLALLYREIEDTDAARGYFRRALDAAARKGVPSAYAPVIGSYASLLNDVGEHDQALAAAEEALAIDAALGDLPHQGLEHLEIARALIGRRRPDEAEPHLDEALRLGRALGQREIVARTLLASSEVALAGSDLLRARGLLDEAIAGLEASRLRPQLVQAYALREQLARAERDDAAALRFAHKHADERERLLGVRASRQLAMLEARHARADAEQRLALMAKDAELNAARAERQQLQRRLYAGAAAALAVLLIALVWRHVGVHRLYRALAARNGEIERQRAALAEANAQLARQAGDLYQAATTDWLTGAANRRHLLGVLDRRIAECRRDGADLALLLVDFDHFKEINDRHGHAFGDRALVEGARAMRGCIGADGLLGRIGGEEFVVVPRERDGAEVMALAERIRACVGEALAALAPERSATISVGVAFLAALPAQAPAGALLEAADRALYAAKSEGRNRVRRHA